MPFLSISKNLGKCFGDVFSQSLAVILTDQVNPGNELY
jgi:hypothetical protein